MNTNSGRLVTGHHHRHPEVRQAAGATELEVLKASLDQQLRQGAAAPELDVAAVPERVGVRVPFAGQREDEVLQVAVIRSGADEPSAGLERRETAARITART